jgi:hypothetical protein
MTAVSAWVSAALAVVAISLYILGSHVSPWSAKGALGLAFGFLAAAVLVVGMAYPWGSAERAGAAAPIDHRLGRHVHWGLLGLLLAFLHAGGLSHGPQGWWLLGLMTWVTVSGVLGLVLRRVIPARLAEQLAVQTPYERIPEAVAALGDEAEAILEGGSEPLQDFYFDKVHKRLVTVRPFSMDLVMDLRAGRERELLPFRSMVRYVDEAERAKVDGLAELFVRKLELDADRSNQALLRGWFLWSLHVPAAGVLLGLLAIHVAAWDWF